MHPLWVCSVYTVFMVCVHCRQVGGRHAQIHPVITQWNKSRSFWERRRTTHSSSLPWRSHCLRNLSRSFFRRQDLRRGRGAKKDRGGPYDVVKKQTNCLLKKKNMCKHSSLPHTLAPLVSVKHLTIRVWLANMGRWDDQQHSLMIQLTHFQITVHTSDVLHVNS